MWDNGTKTYTSKDGICIHNPDGTVTHLTYKKKKVTKIEVKYVS